MYKLKLLISLMITMFIVIVVNITVYADAMIPVSEFENEKFYNYVLEQYDTNQDGILMESEVNTVEYFTLFDSDEEYNLVSFKGIEHFTSLWRLEIKYNNSLTNFEYIMQLPELESLEIGYCSGITDFSFLNEMTYLTDIGLCGTSVSDLSFLYNMPNLEGLNLEACPNVNDFTPIASCTNLNTIFLRENPQLTDISFLDGKDIKYLFLWGSSNIVDYSVLNQFELASLDMDGTNLTNVSFLANCISMHNIRIKNATNVTDYSYLENCKGMMDLYLDNCNVSDISWASNMTRLRDVYLPNNNITDITPLTASANSIIWLNLNNNNISDASVLSNLKAATSIGISDNNLTELPDMKNNTSLEALYDTGNNITYEEALEKLPLGILYNSNTLHENEGVENNEETTTVLTGTVNNEDETGTDTVNKLITSVIDEEVQAEGEFDEDIYLEGKRIHDLSAFQDMINSIYETLIDVEEIRIYDISLYKNNIENDSIVKIKVQPNSTIKVIIDIKSVKGSGCIVYRQEEDGTMTELDSYMKDGKLHFYTDHFSIFTLVITKLLGPGSDTEEVTEEVIVYDESQTTSKNEKVTEVYTSSENEIPDNEEQTTSKHNKVDRKKSRDASTTKVIIVSIVVGIVVLDIVAYEVYVWDRKKKIGEEV